MALGRGARWLLAGLAGLVALVLATALLLPYLVDVQRFAPIVSAQLRQITGREVTLGTIALRVLPVPAVTIAPVTVGEGPRYPGREAVRLRSLQVRLRPLPLLRGRLVLSSIILDRPTVTLIRDSQGRWSFDDLVERATAASKAEEAGGAAGPAAAPALGVAKAAIRGGRVLIYDDAVVPGARSQATIGPIDATLEGWGLGGRTTIDMTLGLGESRIAAKASLASGGPGPEALAVELPGSRLRAVDLRPLFPWLGVASTAGLQVGGTLGVEGKAHVPLSGVEAVAFEGTVDVDQMRYKDASLARPIEKIGGRLSVNGARATWEGFTASLGPSEVHGRLEVEDYLH